MIFIVHSVPATRDSLHFLLETEESPSATDCVILDVDMPEMRSLELIERMHARGITLPVVVTISLPTLVATRRLGAANICAIVEKPYISDEILAPPRATLGPR
jgi:FixJ family two-component response regulator